MLRYVPLLALLMTAGCSTAVRDLHQPPAAAPAPRVDMTGVSPAAYRRDLADCRTYTAVGLPHQHERIVDNCLTGRGYVVLQPGAVAVAPAGKEPSAVTRQTMPTTSAAGLPVRTVVPGRELVQAERYASSQRCVVMPRTLLVSRGPGYETYNVACEGGDALAVRCEFGNCRGLP